MESGVEAPPSFMAQLSQQALASVRPLWTPWRIATLYALISLVFIPIGAVYMSRDPERTSIEFRYDGPDPDSEDCAIESSNEGKECQISIRVDYDLHAPVFVYYGLSNFYQNYQSYVTSYSQSELLGGDSRASLDESCGLLNSNGTIPLKPCGLVANTLFNDKFVLANDDLEMSEDGITWESDADKYKQPKGFVYTLCESGDCESCLNAQFSDSGDSYEACKIYDDVSSGNAYAFWYPDDDQIQYLYETFPDVISPIEGVENEHFINWMRTAGLPTFRKLYGVIESDIPAGTTLVFNVTANFLSDTFNGYKAIIVGQSGTLGLANAYWGTSFLAVGFLVLAAALIIALVQMLKPVKLADLDVLLADVS